VRLALAAIIGAFGLAACHPSDTYRPPPPVDNGEHVPTAELAGDDDFAPAYGKPELEKALIAERAAEARQERAITDAQTNSIEASTNDQLRAQIADLAVRRRFIASLEACQSRQRNCPPRLDEPAWVYDLDDADAKPPLDTPLRFDRDTWQKLAIELHGRACACRTISCVDGVGVVIDQLEGKPMLDVQGDESASESITRARQCLYRLRGKLDAGGSTAPMKSVE
jgi:hypothetical protein